MARRSLKPQLNQIRAWVQQGRTDAWIAHQLEVPTSELRDFRKQHDLTPDEEGAGGAEVDLRDEIEAEIEAATAEEAEEAEKAEEAEAAEEEAEEDEGEEPESEAEKKAERPEKRERPKRNKKEGEPEEGEAKPSGEKKPRRRRRRGRRGGRGRRKELEATFDHGERDGYGLWLDPAVKDNPVYSEHWAGKREVSVRIEADQIVIRRAGEPAGGSGDSDD
jgi:TATA-binding protein-associated factor Taf7